MRGARERQGRSAQVADIQDAGRDRRAQVQLVWTDPSPDELRAADAERGTSPDLQRMSDVESTTPTPEGSRKLKPFLIRTTDGEREAFCRGCETWKPIDTFPDDKRHQGPWHGKKTRCRPCFAKRANERIATRKDEVDRRRRELARARKGGAKKADAALRQQARKRHLVVLGDKWPVVQGWVQELVERHGSIIVAAEISGIHDRRLRALLHAETASVESETLDLLAVAADKQLELSQIDPEPGVEGWSRKHRHCQDCGSWFHRHKAKGLCVRCYAYQLTHDGEMRDTSGKARRGRVTDWAPTLGIDACVVCHKSDQRHSANGICVVCANRAYKRAKRAGVWEKGMDLLPWATPATTRRNARGRQDQEDRAATPR